MAWEIGPFFIGPGQTGTWEIFWPDLSYQGVQHVQPRPASTSFGTPYAVVVVAQGVKFFGPIDIDGNTSNQWSYVVTLREDANRTTTFWLTGGQVP